MQYLQLTEAQKGTMREQLAQGDYFSKRDAKVVEFMLDDDASGYSRGALALEHSSLIPYDSNGPEILPHYKATQCELIELEKISFVITTMNLKGLQCHIDNYVQGAKTLHEIKSAVEAMGGCIIRFNV